MFLQPEATCTQPERMSSLFFYKPQVLNPVLISNTKISAAEAGKSKLDLAAQEESDRLFAIRLE